MQLQPFAFLEWRNWKWSPARIIGCAVGLWLLLALLTAPGRICAPILSNACVAHAWSFIGDLVWFRSLKEWETLATGALAILAALITGLFIQRQIQQAEAHERERQRRALASARSALPRALDQLVDYLEEIAGQLRPLLAACRGGQLPSSIELPDFALPPLGAEATIIRVVEASDASVGALFSHITSTLQVLGARLAAFRESQRPSARRASEIEDRILDVVELHAHCLGLFPYARPDTKEAPTAAVCNDLLRSLRKCGFQIESYPTLTEKVTARLLRKSRELAEN